MAALVDIAGLRLLVVGGGAGIGAACVALAQEAGAEVAATILPGEIASAGYVAEADVADAAQVRSAVDGAATALGGLDAVILTAGIFDFRGLTDTAEEDWRRVLSINLDGAYNTARAAEPYLRESRGSLVLFSSQVGLVGHPRATAYAASKAAVNGLARTLAIEFAPWGGRANAVAPGPVETGMTAVARADETRRNGLLAQIPLARFGTPDEVARTALFLASPASGFITGHVLVVDGGVTAQ